MPIPENLWIRKIMANLLKVFARKIKGGSANPLEEKMENHPKGSKIVDADE
ncbi:MAG: hypothetical protein HY954_03975 [Deltaproteobacteria bacterium]|nr:hypothetical protein [Deltaproteobacteria bacterium]